MRRMTLAAACLALSMAGAAHRASATETISVGTMQLTTAGGIILAEANGDFAREGLEIRHVWAQAAQDTVMAAAAGSIDIAGVFVPLPQLAASVVCLLAFAGLLAIFAVAALWAALS